MLAQAAPSPEEEARRRGYLTSPFPLPLPPPSRPPAPRPPSNSAVYLFSLVRSFSSMPPGTFFDQPHLPPSSPTFNRPPPILPPPSSWAVLFPLLWLHASGGSIADMKPCRWCIPALRPSPHDRLADMSFSGCSPILLHIAAPPLSFCSTRQQTPKPVATRSPPSRETQAVTACVAEVAGKVYLNMIMEILVIIIMLHHGADN